jgi:DNA helicase HerA-like ATPase
LSSESAYFDTMGGEFDARLKRNTMTTRTSKSDGRELTVSNPLAIIEARFSYKVLDRLYFPSFVAIEREVAGERRYIVYEVVGVSPTHYQLPGIDSSMPTLLRKEYLDTIKESWGKSQETWIDLAAIPTSYLAKVDGDTLEFTRTPFAPLPGAQAWLLSKEAVERFLCVAGGEYIGTMQGFDLPFTADMDSLIRYHTGFFAYTGSGKSNLASNLLRQALKRDPTLTVVVLDIAGEYVVNLMDILGGGAKIYSSEIFDSAEEFVRSQAIPESLEELVGRDAIERALRKVYSRGVERLSLRQGGGLDLAWIQALLESSAEGGKAGSTSSKQGLFQFTLEFYDRRSLRPSAKIAELDDDSKAALGALLTDIRSKVHQMSGLKNELDLIIEIIESGPPSGEESTRLNPEMLAETLAKGDGARLNVLYLPEPMMARQATERLIRRLLFLKKKYGNQQRILILLDEAQEYIPDEHTDREFTTQSNRAVEQLLRQGRKYRLHCWMATQRVARLNVNALQQLHSYFVSTLPRMYDRMVIADAFALPYEVLERSADLGTGEWLFVSFKASKQKNVPVFLRTDNNEAFVAESLKRSSSPDRGP